MTEEQGGDPDQTILWLQSRLHRLKQSMLSGTARPRLVIGAVAMHEARRDRRFANMLLCALDGGSDRVLDTKSVAEFVVELEDLWGLAPGSADRPSHTPGPPAG